MPKLTDDAYKKLYCYWAEQHYGLEGVTEVTFDIKVRGPYSDVTPDVAASVEESNVFDLINSINSFITENVAVGIRHSFILSGKRSKTPSHPIRRRRYQGE